LHKAAIAFFTFKSDIVGNKYQVKHKQTKDLIFVKNLYEKTQNKKIFVQKTKVPCLSLFCNKKSSFQ